MPLTEFNAPWIKYAALGAGLVAVYLGYRYVYGSNGANTGSNNNSSVSALTTLQMQQNQIAAQQQATTISDKFKLTLDAQQAAEKLQQSQLSAQTSLSQQTNQINGTLALASIQEQGQLQMSTQANQEQTTLAKINQQNILSQLGAEISMQQNALSAALSMSNIQATENTTLAQINAGVEETISNNNTAVSLANSYAQYVQSNQARSIGGAQRNSNSNAGSGVTQPDGSNPGSINFAKVVAGALFGGPIGMFSAAISTYTAPATPGENPSENMGAGGENAGPSGDEGGGQSGGGESGGSTNEGSGGGGGGGGGGGD